MTTDTGDKAASTSWLRVTVAIAGGVAIATQHGKMAAAVSVLREDMGLSLTQVGFLASILPLGTAIFGALGAQLAAWLGVRHAAVLGLSLCAVGSLAGAATDSFASLFATRLVESAGFLLAVVTLPTLTGQSASDKHRPLAMGIWAGFIPAGFTLGLVVGAMFLDTWGWNGLWLASGIFAAAVAVPAFFLDWKKDEAQATSNLGWLLKKPVAWALAAAFFLFSLQFLGVNHFMSTMLQDTSGWGLGQANLYVAFIIALNIAGNVIGGKMVGAGLSLRHCFTLVFVTMLVCLAVLFLPGLPFVLRLASGAAFGLVSGILPGAVWAFIPTAFELGKRTTALTGFVMQGAAIGQLTGPVTVGFAVDITGSWPSVIVPVGVACAAGLVLSWSVAALRQDAGGKNTRQG